MYAKQRRQFIIHTEVLVSFAAYSGIWLSINDRSDTGQLISFLDV